MKLYLRLQVEEYACDKWNGLEGLEVEKQRREKEVLHRKQKRFRKQIAG